MKSNKIKMNYRSISIILLALLLSWVLAFPFEGQILIAVAWHFKQDVRGLIYAGILAYSLGTLVSDSVIKNGRRIKQLFIGTTILCITTSFVFLFGLIILWYIMLIASMFFAGCCFAAWSIYYFNFTPSNDRMRTAADVLIYNNIFMLIIGLIVVYLSYVAGLLFGILLLTAALLVAHKIPERLILPERASDQHGFQHNLGKGFLLLLIFIFTVSINVGLAYQVLFLPFHILVC